MLGNVERVDAIAMLDVNFDDACLSDFLLAAEECFDAAPPAIRHSVRSAANANDGDKQREPYGKFL